MTAIPVRNMVSGTWCWTGALSHAPENTQSFCETCCVHLHPGDQRPEKLLPGHNVTLSTAVSVAHRQRHRHTDTDTDTRTQTQTHTHTHTDTHTHTHTHTHTAHCTLQGQVCVAAETGPGVREVGGENAATFSTANMCCENMLQMQIKLGAC